MYTFPTSEILEEFKAATPDYMHPNDLPWIVVYEECLSSDTCQKIIDTFKTESPFQFPGCHAKTCECSMPLSEVLDPVSGAVLDANDRFWQYDLTMNPSAYIQTYFEGDSYAMHMDAAPGQTRKLTAVALLTDPEEYYDGDLKIYIPPSLFVVPRIQGTIVVFPYWVMHVVTEVTFGVRQTINLGFWGPPFR